MVIKNIEVKDIMTKTNLPVSDYAVNPYVGCTHACKYCYASFMKRFTNHPEPWGDFIYSFSYDEDDPEYAKYTPLAEDTDETYENVYFVSDYAKISNTEDIAEMIGNLMQDTAVPECFKSPHLKAKCEFLFERIRLAFDSQGWPEQTYWEERLAETEQ